MNPGRIILLQRRYERLEIGRAAEKSACVVSTMSVRMGYWRMNCIYISCTLNR